MDDQRDYEEERAQEAALREEQAGEAEGLETLGNTDPVDSTSEDYVGPEATVEAEEEEDDEGVMLWQAGSEGIAEQMADILELSKFAKRHAVLTHRLIDAGAPAEAGEIEVGVNALQAQALSVGLNLVGFFVPELADEAEALLRSVADARRAWKPSDEQQAAYDAARTQVEAEDLAELYGMTVEELKEAREQALKEAVEREAAAADEAIQVSTGGEPHLN